MIRTFRYPLRPTKAQEATLDVYLWRCRQLYNAALEQRRDAYRKQGKTLSYMTQTRDLTELRDADPDFIAVPTTILRSALKRLDLAYKAFFRRLRAGENPGFPRFKGRDRFKSFSFMREPVIEDSKILIPKLGYVKFHAYRPIQGTPLDASIRRDSSGKWWVSIQCEMGEAPAKTSPITHTGIDVGLTSFATLSTGETVDNPRFFRVSELRLAERQRKLALKRRGSKSRQRAKRLVVLGLVAGSPVYADPATVAQARYLHEEQMALAKARAVTSSGNLSCANIIVFDANAKTKPPPFAADWQSLAAQAHARINAKIVGDVAQSIGASSTITSDFLANNPIDAGENALHDLLTHLSTAMAPLDVPGCVVRDSALQANLETAQARIDEIQAALKTERDCRSLPRSPASYVTTSRIVLPQRQT